jgi:adenosylhomocysteine nucleosidase
VVDAATDQRLVPTLDAPMHGTLVTMDRIVASPADKSRLYHEQQVTAVDMETAGIAQVCAGNSVPWLCVRAVLDRADQVLPGALVGLTRADGRASFPAAVLYALTRPWRVPLLLGLPRRVRAAMQAATEQLVPWL